MSELPTAGAVRGMEAGRELDCLVAEYIFGWDWINEVTWSHPPTFGAARYRVVVDAPHKHGTHVAKTLPKYSADIADAWKIVERLQDQSWQHAWWYFSLDFYPGRHDGKPYWVCANLDAYSRTHNESISTKADTAPLAICRAALLSAIKNRGL